MTEQQMKQLEALGIDVTTKEITHRWNDQKFIHVSPPKWGKSILWAQDESSFFFRLENRHNHFKNVGVDCRSFRKCDDTLTGLLTIAKKGKFPFSCAIVDPVDRLIYRIDEDVIEWAESLYRTNYNTIGDIPNGAGWARRKALINGFLARLEGLPCAKVLLFHSHVEEQDDRTGKKKKKKTIDVGGKAGGNLIGWSDHILHGELVNVGNDVVRRIHTKGTETMEAGKSNPKMPDMMVQKTETSKGPEFPVIRENFMALKNCFEYEKGGQNDSPEKK